jgi:thiamine pyrophosphate-dependent acetolactate synthase large subunit-like protein
MSVNSALLHLSARRGDNDVVVTNQSSARLWPRLSDHPLDFNYNPSTMSGAVPLGVGLALAQREREVIVLSGDGSLLMSLGCLVTAASSGATNLSILLLDNGMYEVTGGQRTAASRLDVDYVGLARSVGIASAVRFCEIEAWESGSEDFFASDGPRFAWLQVGPTPQEVLDENASLLPIHERIRQLQETIAR